jgi:fused signal recognition particle receptor
MSGFFKKLFNRITGKKDEPAAEVVIEQAQLPAPAPIANDVQDFETPPPSPPVKPPVAEVKPAKKTEEAKKPAAKIAPPKKPEAKKQEAKKPEAKKPAAKRAPPKKAEAKKPEPKKPEAKKPAAKVKAVPVKAPPPTKAKVAKPQPVKVAPAPRPVPAPTSKAKPLAPKPVPPLVEEVLPPPVVVVPEPEVVVPLSPPPPEPPPAAAAEEKAVRKGWFSRLTEGLSKSSKSITGSITAIFTKRKLDKDTLQELEDTLIQADLGLAVAERIIAEVSRGRFDKEIDPEEVKQILAAEVAKTLKPVEVPFNFGTEKPFVILVVGVNGSGKTTTIGKLGAIAAGEGFKVKFAACDTFRAAAIEQLTVWGKRVGAETIARPQGADAAGLAFDAMKASREDGTDILFIDTAGRLHNKTYLMDELDKVVRVIKKYDDQAPHAVLLVLDATTGQNALAQAEAFTKVAGVTGLIMTKLDGTARGGILVAIAEKFKLPIHAIGVGETIDDLQAFDAEAFSRAIAGLDDKT